jgi:flagellar basal-body rod protein FlgC
MSLFDAMDIAGSSLSAQTVRLNSIASNMANANTVASSPEDTYRARTPLFKAVLETQLASDRSQMGVQIDRMEEVGGDPRAEFNPGHPLADEEGYIYRPNIDVATEMVNMMQASRSFQNSIEAINTAKQLAMRTLTLGK